MGTAELMVERESLDNWRPICEDGPGIGQGLGGAGRGRGLGRVGSRTSLGMLGHVRNFQDHQQSTLSDKKVTKLPDLPIFSQQQPGFRMVVRDSVIWWRETSFDTVSI